MILCQNVIEHPWATACLLLVAYWLYKELTFSSTIAQVPVVGVPFGGYLGSWVGGIYFTCYGHKVIRAGYKKYPIFQVAMIERMLVIVTKLDMIEELCNAPIEQLSFLESINDDFQVKYTMSLKVKESLWHIPIISDQLTKKLMSSLPAMQKEIHGAFDDIFNIQGNDWNSVKIMDKTLTLFARLINFFFVGSPLCHDPEFIENCVGYAADVAIGGYLIRIWPEWFKPFVAKFATRIPARLERAKKALIPLIRSRLDKMELLGSKWDCRPDDFLQWLIEGSIQDTGARESELDTILRLMFVNFAGIHTSAQMFALALYELVKRPQYIEPLRQEAKAMVARHGYTTVAFNKMSKLDSFTRECSRYISLGSIVTTRKAMVPYTFANGIYMPRGVYICAPHHSVHRDDAHYPEADNFDGYRFHKMRKAVAVANPESKQHEKTALWTGTAPNHLFFGYGKHPCPGRFFASLTSKMLFHHLLVHFDFKLADPRSPPKPMRFQTMYIPDPKANILFRRRSAAASKTPVRPDFQSKDSACTDCSSEGEERDCDLVQLSD